MPFKVQLVFEDEADGSSVVQEIAQLQRDTLSPATLGLTLAEAKTLLHNVQSRLVEQQVAAYQRQQRPCPHCQQRRRVKEHRRIVYRTLFGKLKLQSPRLFHCDCQPCEAKSFNPLSDLLVTRTAPELLYLESKFASLMSYGLSVKLLAEVLPIDEHLNATTVRNHTQQVAQTLESELGDEQFAFIEGCERDWEALPRPDMPLTVGIDGGYVHSCESQADSARSFEIITGKSIADDGSSKCFGLVNSYDKKPKRRVFEVLKSQGMQMNQQVTFLSDGGDTVRDLQLYLNPQAEHLLDWFHITMRITVMNQMAKGMKHQDEAIQSTALDDLESIKWYLWHGNVFRALQKIESLFYWLDTDETCPEQEKLLKQVQDFHTYSPITKSSFPTMGSAIAMVKGFRQALSNQRSIR